MAQKHHEYILNISKPHSNISDSLLDTDDIVRGF